MFFSVQSACFLLVPNEQNQRALSPGKVLSINGRDAVIQFEEAVGLQPGDDATIFANIRGKFFQQAVTIAAMPAEQVMGAGANPDSVPAAPAAQPAATSTSLIAVTCVGEPVSAESRGSFRVSIASCEYQATVAGQKNCLLVDISPEGCAVISAKPLALGSAVDVNFTIDNVTVSGKLRVQTAKQLRSGKLRFGLLAAEKKSALRAALEKLSPAMQRQQLRRLSGAA